MTPSADTRPSATGPTIAGVAGLLSRPRIIATACMVVLVACGWAYLLTAALWQGASGPGGFFDAICRAVPIGATGSIESILLVAAMWVAMTLAMMLPTAGPMILTYAEIAETAQRKGKSIVSPHVLIAGYLTVWLGFAGLATLVQLCVTLLAAQPGMLALAAPAGALLFLLAGLYQFSALKQACLRACQRPFSFFFLNWTDRPRGVFALGARQGLYCLGCCWAMMLLMFAAGSMNPLWMAVLGIVMMAEKMTKSPHLSRATGVAFAAAGLTILAVWGWQR